MMRAMQVIERLLLFIFPDRSIPFLNCVLFRIVRRDGVFICRR